MKSAGWILAAALVVAAAPGNAAIYVFELSGAANVRFEIDSNPVVDPSQVYEDAFRLNGVQVSYEGAAPVAQQIAFFDEPAGGGVELFPPGGGPAPAGSYAPAGVVLYTGAKSAPQFKLGTFALTDFYTPTMSYTLKVSALQAGPNAVPEPDSWAMLILGFGVVGAAMRRPKGRVRLA